MVITNEWRKTNFIFVKNEDCLFFLDVTFVNNNNALCQLYMVWKMYVTVRVIMEIIPINNGSGFVVCLGWK